MPTYPYLENPYSGETNTFKGQIHAHTNNTDGAESPADVVSAYKDAGYDFISITDHEYSTPDPGVEGITFIPGVEGRNGSPHVTVLNAVDTARGASANAYAARHKADAIIGIPHPNFNSVNGWTQNQIDGMADYRLMEVYNGKMDTAAEITARSKFMSTYDNGRRVWCTAVDDSHVPADIDKGWIMVHAASNSKLDILDAIRRGDFYASTGSDLTIEVDGLTITATSPHAGRFRFVDSSWNTPLKLANNTAGGSVSYTVIGTGNAVWITHEKTGSDGITDAAWAQPIFIRKSA